MNGKRCLKENLDFVVKRSALDKSLDQIWLNSYKNISWLSGWGWIEIILSSIYILWFALWSKQDRPWRAVLLACIAVILFLNLTQVLRLVAPFPYPPYFGSVNCQHGTVIFHAVLSKIHYETPIILLVGILSEFGVLILMWYQVRQVLLDRKRLSSNNSSSVRRTSNISSTKK
jgi:hypothetical protein